MSTMAKQLSLNQFFKKPRLQTEESSNREEKRDKTGPGNEGETATMSSSPSPESHASLCANDPAPALTHRLPLAASNEPIRTPSDLSPMEEPATQPKLTAFPATVIGGKSRSFNASWYGKYKWIEYSKEQDTVFCKACRHFPEMHTETTFIRGGYKNWKRLGEACDKHESSKPHAIALTKLASFRDSHAPQSRGTVLNQLHGDAPAFVERNREHVKVVLDIAMLCAKLEIPLRGHRETEDALNKGNFLELFKFVSTYAPEIENRLKELPQNATLMSHQVQDELLEAAASILLRKIKAELHGQYFAILADEYKDLAKRELVAVCVRFIHGGVIKERAVGFVEAADLSAQGISQKILEVLQPLELDPSLCVGLCFDGASVMSGHRGGVQVVLRQTFPQAIYVHCNSHRLNLVLCSAAKESGHVSTFFDTVNQIHSFFTGAQRHARFMEIQKEMHPDRQSMELERSSDTRWSSKSGSVHKIFKLLDVLLEALAECTEGSGQTRIEAEQLLQQMQTKKFIFMLVTFCKLFENSDFATKGLQSSTLCVTDCISLIETLKATYATFRDDSDGDFEKVLRLTEELLEKHEIANWDVAASRERKLPSKFHTSVVTTTLGKTSAIKSDADLKALWNSVLDRQISELNSRFKEDTYGVMRASASFAPESATFGDKDILKAPCDLYGIEIADAEHSVFTQHIRRKMDQDNFPTLMEILDSCPPDIFPNMNSLLRAIITLPLTSCSVERLFSATNRIQARLRSSMLTGRLNNLTLLSFEREMIDSSDYDDIINAFNSKPRRLRLV